MLAKFTKSVVVLAVALTFFGGSAMADNWGRDGRHHQKRHHYYSKHHPKVETRHHHRHRPHVVCRDYVRVAPPRPHHRPHRHEASSVHSLAPRIAFLGPLPIPVPPPPDEVLGYLTGR